ncbi:hypothetical protein CLG96_05965 [Sphingomonas oleivorans]|uniref:Uncharacterized protein n=1 Tax=Sphingomonas oleivorans TaxID=1735121 RepID=A0A2T5FZI2_9SPHN|nr:hypothetical protein [Sphingomonas oleivorans]PTQ12109.1 hypothetical protein CLG96_05965 [Sphingomonas oleivorans]
MNPADWFLRALFAPHADRARIERNSLAREQHEAARQLRRTHARLRRIAPVRSGARVPGLNASNKPEAR